MFKVICIDASVSRNNGKPLPLKECEIYTVIRHTNIQRPGYVLLEVKSPYNDAGSFDASRFIPLSNIDETNLVNTIKQLKLFGIDHI